MGKTYRRDSEKKFRDFRGKSKPNKLKHDKPKRKWNPNITTVELDSEEI